MTRIVSWNIDKGGIDEHGVADALEELNPDVAVLIEARQPSSTGDLAAVLRGRGWRWMAMSTIDAKGNAIGVVSRDRFDAQQLGGDGLEHGTVMRISLPSASFDVYGCEFPPTGKKWSHRLMWDAVMAQANASAKPVMIVGDLNTGAHEIDEEGSCICRNDFADLAAIGWRDLYREQHGQQLAFSWRSPYGNRFRMDHALARADLAAEITRIEYVNHLGRRPLWPGVAYPGQKVLSDHAPLVIDVAGVSTRIDGGPHGGGWLHSLRTFAATCLGNVAEPGLDPTADLAELEPNPGLITADLAELEPNPGLINADLAERTALRIDAGEIEQVPTLELRRCLSLMVAGIDDDHALTPQLELDLRSIEAELLRRHRRML